MTATEAFHFSHLCVTGNASVERHRTGQVTTKTKTHTSFFFFFLADHPLVSGIFSQIDFPDAPLKVFLWPKLCILHAFNSTYYPQKPAGGQRGPNPSSSAWPSSEPAQKNGALSLPLLSPPPSISPPFPKPTKKSTPLNSTATPRSLTGEANLRGALCFRLRHTLAIHMWLTVWRCGGQKTTTKISIMKYGVWLGI